MNRTTRAATALLAACAALLCGCAAVVVGGAAAGGYYLGKDDRSPDVVASDASITAEVKARLIEEPGIRSGQINVDTHESVVTLRGEVASVEQSGTVVRIATNVKGVKSVTNELKVK